MTLDEIIALIGIEPYYREDAGVIYNCDCLDIMKQMPEKCVDLVVTDPQYGIGESNEKNITRGCLARTTNFGHYDWDKKPPPRQAFVEMMRVSDNQIIFGGNYFVDYLYNSSCWIVWDKDNGKTDFADCELAWTSFKTAVRKFKWRWQGMLQEDMSNKEKRIHPTQKPLPLMKWIIGKYSSLTDLIYDPFAGSLTTCVAAKQLGRKYIGVEISEAYCKIAVQRLAQEVLI